MPWHEIKNNHVNPKKITQDRNVDILILHKIRTLRNRKWAREVLILTLKVALPKCIL